MDTHSNLKQGIIDAIATIDEGMKEIEYRPHMLRATKKCIK